MRVKCMRKVICICLLTFSCVLPVSAGTVQVHAVYLEELPERIQVFSEVRKENSILKSDLLQTDIPSVRMNPDESVFNPLAPTGGKWTDVELLEPVDFWASQETDISMSNWEANRIQWLKEKTDLMVELVSSGLIEKDLEKHIKDKNVDVYITVMDSEMNKFMAYGEEYLDKVQYKVDLEDKEILIKVFDQPHHSDSSLAQFQSPKTNQQIADYVVRDIIRNVKKAMRASIN